MNDCQDKLAGIIGAKVLRATSSLHQFAIEFSGDQCLILDAVAGETGPTIEPTIADATRFPPSGDVVCAVDWSWISGGELKEVKAGSDQVKLTLAPQGLVTVSVAVWQGKPFLSFMPYKAPAK
jgi:hypothetical protein